MSKEYLVPPNPNIGMGPQPQMQPQMQPQPPKKDNRVVILLSVILAVLLALVTVFVFIFMKSKDDKNENPNKTQSQSVAASENGDSQGTKDFIDGGSEVPHSERPIEMVCPICASDSITSPDANGFKTCNICGAKWTEDGDSADNGETNNSGTMDFVKPADGVETLEFFNSAINRVKTNATSVNQKSVENYLASSPTIPNALNGIYSMLGGDSWLDEMLKDNSQGAATYTGADIKAKFPVEGESYASQLQPADVKAATCTEANGIYTITITTLADGDSTNHEHGAGHNPKALNVILPSTVNDNIPDTAKSNVGEASMAYPSSTITITVDAATGNVLTADYDLKWTIRFTKMNATIPLGTRSSYEIKW